MSWLKVTRKGFELLLPDLSAGMDKSLSTSYSRDQYRPPSQEEYRSLVAVGANQAHAQSSASDISHACAPLRLARDRQCQSVPARGDQSIDPTFHEAAAPRSGIAGG